MITGPIHLHVEFNTDGSITQTYTNSAGELMWVRTTEPIPIDGVVTWTAVDGSTVTFPTSPAQPETEWDPIGIVACLAFVIAVVSLFIR